MQIQKNSRQVPKTKEIISNKMYTDILYAHLQVISKRDENGGHRWLDKKDLNQSALSRDLGISRPTIAKKLNNLVEMGLLVQTSDQYILRKLEPKEAFLIPQETLRKMVSTLKERTIDVYVYLVNRYYANNEEPFITTIGALKEFCGISVKTMSNNYIIKDILDVLSLMGLVEYVSRDFQNKKGQIKHEYEIRRVNLNIL